MHVRPKLATQARIAGGTLASASDTVGYAAGGPRGWAGCMQTPAMLSAKATDLFGTHSLMKLWRTRVAVSFWQAVGRLPSYQ